MSTRLPAGAIARARHLRRLEGQVRIGSDGDWTNWLIGTTSTSATFGPVNPVHLRDGTTYYFRCRAVDYASNEEAYPAGDGDAWTTVHMHSVFLAAIMR